MLVLLLLITLALPSSSSSSALFKNASAAVQDRVRDLLARMSLEEKIGQMTQIERSVANTSDIQTYFVGSILSGGGSAPSDRASASEWADMVERFQKAALGTRLGIPIMYGIDAVHGHNNVFGATIFPHNVGLGCTRDPELAMRIGAATALEVRGTGIPYVFAPCIAVCRNPSWGRCYESFSEDPQLVRNMTQIIVGLQGKASTPSFPFVAGQHNVAATAKHFVGDGGTVHGIDENNTVMSFKSLVDIHMAAYFDAIAKGVATIMVSYSSWNGQKMHDNHFLISHVLKKQLGFEGFVISDWQGIDRITSPPDANYSFSVSASINAGLDMIMIPYNLTLFHNDLLALVRSGHVSMERIDDAVGRILRVKFITGLFEQPWPDRSLAHMVGAQAHRDLAREAVRKSLVLLKNEKLLPLDKKAPKILVAGSHANDLGSQCGGWTITWQGATGNTTVGTTILEAITSTVSSSTKIEYEQFPDAKYAQNGGFSYAVVVVGEMPYAEYVGDKRNLTIPEAGIQTIENVCRGVKCVVVLISGRPLVVEPYLAMMDALVAAWLPGTQGHGITDVLFGDFPFVGTLSRSWFKRADQLPMNWGDVRNYDPLFPYGFGLRTTSSSFVGSAALLWLLLVLLHLAFFISI